MSSDRASRSAIDAPLADITGVPDAMPMRVAIILAGSLLSSSVAATSRPTDEGYVVVRSDPLWIDSIGVGPGVCFSTRCALGVVLRKNGTGALLEITSDGQQETKPFKFDPKRFEALSTDVSKIKYRGLPCKMILTDGGGASVFWTVFGQRIVIGFTNGCINKDDPAVVAVYDKIIRMPEVADALRQAAG